MAFSPTRMDMNPVSQPLMTCRKKRRPILSFKIENVHVHRYLALPDLELELCSAVA
jgi:hypothetical protein